MYNLVVLNQVRVKTLTLDNILYRIKYLITVLI